MLVDITECFNLLNTVLYFIRYLTMHAQNPNLCMTPNVLIINY